MTDDLVTRAKGRLAFLVDRGEIKTPELIVEFIARIERDAATIARLEAERDEWRDTGEALPAVNREAVEQRARAEAAEAKVAALVEALEQLVIEYDEVDLAIAEPKSLTDAVSAARAAIAATKGGA